MKLILTCEHGGNTIPRDYQKYFEDNEHILQSHRGFDLGALDIFNIIEPLAEYSNYSKTSRLLIELNRSLQHKNLFSEFTKELTESDRDSIIKKYYLPYRSAVEAEIRRFITNNETVIHISIHSFTPVFNAIQRSCDFGILYDSSKQSEKLWASQLKDYLKAENSNLNIRYNYPYLGKADGFTTYLRQQFPNNYLGIELEINQKFSIQNQMPLSIKNALFQAIKKALN